MVSRILKRFVHLILQEAVICHHLLCQNLVLLKRKIYLYINLLQNSQEKVCTIVRLLFCYDIAIICIQKVYCTYKYWYLS